MFFITHPPLDFLFSEEHGIKTDKKVVGKGGTVGGFSSSGRGEGESWGVLAGGLRCVKVMQTPKLANERRWLLAIMCLQLVMVMENANGA